MPPSELDTTILKKRIKAGIAEIKANRGAENCVSDAENHPIKPR